MLRQLLVPKHLSKSKSENHFALNITRLFKLWWNCCYTKILMRKGGGADFDELIVEKNF